VRDRHSDDGRTADASSPGENPGEAATPGSPRPTVWIFGDLPLRTACGPSYMVESWGRELDQHGWAARLFTPSGGWRRSRTASSVTFRTVRHVGFHDDHHARFSSLFQTWRARRELPDVVLATTPGRVGVLGVTLAARHSLPLVVVESTDVTGAMAHYNTLRMLAAGGVKPVVLAWAAARIRAAIWNGLRHGRQALLNGPALATLYAAAVRAQADAVVLLSTKSLHALRASADRAPKTVIPTGIDRLPQVPPPADLRWREGSLRVLYVGRLSPEKSLSILVRGLRAALDRGVDAHLVLVGDGVAARELAALAQELDVADRVSLLGRHPRELLGGIYASADVFAFPSLVETQAFVLNEAAHEGLPLLVSDPQLNAVVEQGRSALLVAHDPTAYADGLAKLRDPQLRRQLGAGARQLAGQLTEAGQTSRLAGVLSQAIAAHATGRRGIPDQRDSTDPHPAVSLTHDVRVVTSDRCGRP
jgi:glycosyltransferase involved in cell wall biosynthesis